MINLINYKEALKELEIALHFSKQNYLNEKKRNRTLEQQSVEWKSKCDNEEEIQKLKEQIAYKDKIIDDLKHFKYFTNQEIETKEMKIMEQALKIKALQDENELKSSIIQDHRQNKSRLDAVYKILPTLKKKFLKNQEDIKIHLKKHEEERKAFKVENNNKEIQLLQMKKELDLKDKDYHNILEEKELFKEQLAENEKVIRDLDRESRSTSDIIDQNCQLLKEREDLLAQLESVDMNSRETKRKHDEEILTIQRKAMRLEKDCEDLEKTKEKNSKLMMSIKNKNKMIDRQKTNLNIVLDEINKWKR